MSFVSISQEIFQGNCSQWTDCMSCVSDTGCAYCASMDKCIQGNWFGVVNKTMDYCPVTDYYYKQCQFSSLPLGVMACTVLFILLILVLVGLCYLCCRFSCCCRSDQDEEERQALLGTHRSLRRSSTYYQWNRSPPSSTFKRQTNPSPPLQPTTSTINTHHSHHPFSNTSPEQPMHSTVNNMAHDTWESRRSQLLKKYARDPPPS